MRYVKDYQDIEDLKYKIASDPTVISKLALFAHMIGFGWCGGTQTGLVGTGFDLSKEGSTYILKGHYNKNDPHAGGYWSDKRLKITLSDFRFLIDPTNLNYAKPLISSLNPITISTFKGVNKSDSEDTISKDFTYQLSDTISHTSNFGFEEGVMVGAGGKAKVPFVADGEVKTEVTVKSTQGWSDQESKTYTSTDTQSYSGTLPANSSRLINLMVTRTKSEVGYTTDAIAAFTVSYNGFLKWGGNARKDHPKDRPFVTVMFGNGSLSAFEDIVDKYEHRSNPTYSEWDWEWLKKQFGGRVDSIVSFFRNGIGASVCGKFIDVKGVNAEIIANNPEPLTDAESDSDHGIVAVVMAPTAIPHPKEISPHLILQSDELPGGRVISVE